MLRLRSEKILFSLAVIFLALAYISRGWIFIGLAILCWSFGFAVFGISVSVERRPRGIISLCEDCDQLLLITPTNQAPEYSGASDYAEIPKDNMRDFVRRHASHEIKCLDVIFGPWHKGPIDDPMTPSYLVARHKGKLFFIKRHRKSIMEPMGYELIEKGLYDFAWRWRFTRLVFK